MKLSHENHYASILIFAFVQLETSKVPTWLKTFSVLIPCIQTKIDFGNLNSEITELKDVNVECVCID